VRFKAKTRDDPRPDLTPLIDVLFLLIIFFTVTTTFATTGGIDVNLPEAAAQRDLEQARKLHLVINRDGEVFIEGKRASSRELAARFQALKEKDKNALVIIQADKAARHGRVVQVMDQAQSAGLKRLAIATDKKAPDTDEKRSPHPDRAAEEPPPAKTEQPD